MDSLPFELLSLILEIATELNAKQSATFTYGLSQAPLPLQRSALERTVRGHKPLDVSRWDSVDSIRRVCTLWHRWAVGYALQELYVRRWRGSERWEQSNRLVDPDCVPSCQAVYRQPHLALKSTANLLSQHELAGSSVRRLWFDGFYSRDLSGPMLQVSSNCSGLQSVTLPWVSIRYFSTQGWRSLLNKTRLTCLELTAIDLKASQISDKQNEVDLRPLEDPMVNFAGLTRLRIVGSTNFKPLTDADMLLMARSAVSLRELHVTGISTISIKGIMALVEASRGHLETLEYYPLANSGFKRTTGGGPDVLGKHICSRIISCSRLKDLTLSLPTICEEFFTTHDVNWAGDVRLRTSDFCNHHRSVSADSTTSLTSVLEACHKLVASRRQKKITNFNVEMFVENWLFEPSKHRVHGNFETGKEISGFTWPMSESPSCKGPYSHTGLYGKEEGLYSAISEDDFFQGLRLHYISI